MADGHIKIAVEVDGKEVDVASKSLDNLEDAGIKGGKGVKETEEGLKNVGKESDNAGGKVKKFAGALGLIAIGAAAFKVLKSSLDDAITRFDTLNKFPKVLQSLGVSAEESEKAMDRLSDGIDGLPTKLNDITATAQEMYMSFNDMDKATDTALALNNALLASGSSSEQAKRGTQQYIKALQTGKFDMDAWNTLSETMGIGLSKLADEFGFTGESAKQDLYKALQDGSVPMGQFNDKLIELGTGTGELAELAKTNSLGMATSLENLKNAAARGIADMIGSFDKLSREATGKELSEHIDSLKHIINASFKVINGIVEASIPVFKALATVMKPILTIAQKLSPVLIGAGTALGLLTTGLVAARTATLAKAAATKILGTSLKSMMGPVGWVTTGIGALAGAITGIVKWFNRASEEEKELTKETEALAGEVKELNDELDQSAKQHKDNVTEINATAKSNEELMQTVQELSEKENKSASDREMLKMYTEQLNESVDGLNLAYDEQTDSLNMTNAEMNDYVQLMKDQETLEESQNRLVEISKERNIAEEKLKEINEDREEWNKHLEEGGKKGKEAKEAIEELDIAEAELTETTAGLTEEHSDLQDKIEETTISINENSLAQIEQLRELLEEHEDIFNEIKAEYDSLADAATDSFERISDESKHSVDDMIKNLEHNREMTEAWGDNIADLMEFASAEGYEGFMKHLDTMTIDQAAELQEMADSLKEWKDGDNKTLEELAKLYDTNAEAAMDAFNKRMGDGFEEATDIIANFPGVSSDILREEAKSAGFYDIGKEIPAGVAEGAKDGEGDVSDAIEGIAGVAEGAFTKALEIHSPSRVFMEFGTDITDGLALGISDSHDVVKKAITDMFKTLLDDSKKALEQIDSNYKEQTKKITASLGSLVTVTGKGMDNMLNKMQSGAKRQTSEMTRLAASIVSPFSSTMSQFNTIGANAMSGLNAGLNAGRASVIGVARGIANSVASTMQSALRIHSPSRVMRDKIGKWIPAGVAEGMEDNFNFIDKAIQGMNDKFSNMRVGTPEFALGIQGGGSMGASATVNNYTNYNNTSSNQPKKQSENTVIRVEAGDVIMDGRKVGEVQWRHVKEHMDRDEEILNGFRR